MTRAKKTIYDFTVKTIDGRDISLNQYKGSVLLIVNTASRCGFTPQYEGLEKLHKKYAAQGFSVLAFPCNQFSNQEPGNAEEIISFCDLNYKTTFPLFAKIDVNGPEAEPLFEFLKKEKKGLLGSEMIKWNFTKFLVNREGHVFKRFAPQDKPENIDSYIKNLL